MTGRIQSRPYVWQPVAWAEGRVLTRGSVDGLPALTWGSADRAQLATARQLRELGLRPAGAEPVAVLVFGHRHPGRRPIEYTSLYRIAEAAPKRTATPAQREAIERALARRTCQECGAEQDYYLSTVSRMCGPCSEATGFWDDHDQAADHRDHDDVDDYGADDTKARVEAGALTDGGCADPATTAVVDTSESTTQPATAAAGDADAVSQRTGRLAQLYAEYWPHTLRFIGQQVRPDDRDLVEDLAQTTFVRAWPYLDRVEPESDGSLHRWLSTVARHTVADHYRKAPARRGAAETPVAHDSPLWHATALAADPHDQIDAVDERLDLAAAHERLPDETRRVLALRYRDELPINEVAERLGRGRATIVRRAAEGLATLREQLSDHTANTALEPAASRTRTAPTDQQAPATDAEADTTRLAAAGDTDAAQPAAVDTAAAAPTAELKPPPESDETAQAVQRARESLGRLSQRRAEPDPRAVDRARSERLARWHADDQAAEQTGDQACEAHRELEGIAR